jgi:hypothetical protein
MPTTVGGSKRQEHSEIAGIFSSQRAAEEGKRRIARTEFNQDGCCAANSGSKRDYLAA